MADFNLLTGPIDSASYNDSAVYLSLDCFSNNTRRSLLYFARRVMDDLFKDYNNSSLLSMNILLVSRYADYLSDNMRSHALGGILTPEWRALFAQEYMAAANDALWAGVYQENVWFDQNQERQKHIAEYQARQRADDIARALKTLADNEVGN